MDILFADKDSQAREARAKGLSGLLGRPEVEASDWVRKPDAQAAPPDPRTQRAVTEPRVLVVDAFAERGAAVERRLRGLGMRVSRVASLAEAVELAANPRYVFRVALLAPDLPAEDLRATLEALRTSAGSSPLEFVAAGPRPDEEGIERMRAAGVELCLWEPYPDGVLRFQVNRALEGGRPHPMRTATRIPLGLSARAWSRSRSKPVLLTSLSADGAFVETSRPSPRGVELSLDFVLGLRELNVKTTVLYTNVPGNLQREKAGTGMCLCFKDLDPADRAAIEAYVERAERDLTLDVPVPAEAPEAPAPERPRSLLQRLRMIG